MKVAIMGSAPSSLELAPFGDPEFQIWGCSPGLYPRVPRINAWFELHRWEPPVVGVPSQQVPWFSPEYVQWMATRGVPVWMQAKVPEIPTSDAYPVEEMCHKFGTFFFTSSIAWMMAMAIDMVIREREDCAKAGKEAPQSVIGLYGIDMAATEEYGYQRAGCQHFCALAHQMGITVDVPPESDLLRPMPLYGIDEGTHWMIKNTARLRELEGRLANHNQQAQFHQTQAHFLTGAIDDMKYHMQTWGGDRVGAGTHPMILAASPRIQVLVNPPPPVAPPPPVDVPPAPEAAPPA